MGWAVLANQLLAFTAHTTGLVCPTGTLWPAAGSVQMLLLALDSAAVLIMSRRMRKHQSDEKPVSERMNGGGGGGGRLAQECLLAAATMLFLLLITAPFATTSWREIAASSLYRGLVVRDLVLDSILATVTILSGSYLLSHLTPVTVALVGSTAFLSVHHNFQPAQGYGVAHSVSPAAVIVGILALGCLALLSQDTIRADATEASRLSTTSPDNNNSNHNTAQHKKRLLVATLATLAFLLSVHYTQALATQPHDPLPIIQDAQNTANDWLLQASQSQTAHAAAAAYKARHPQHLPPPPHFDQWHAFARQHRSPVLDTFTQIHTDLLPFWGIPPATLRARTRRLLARRPPGLGGLRIRRGTVTTLPPPPGPDADTHASWMLDAYRDMVAPFAAALPDMDVVFNLDDDAAAAAGRVALPAARRAQLLADGEGPRRVLATSRANGHPLRGWFSEAVAEPGWDDDGAAEEEEEEEEEEEAEVVDSALSAAAKPRLSVYDAYVAPTCPAGSAARQSKWWDGSRALPAARGGITATAEADHLCERPDLARMHGFLLSSPATFAVTQHALPIFSQSRLDGFSDILVPSPWHFAADKVAVVDDAAADSMAWQQKQDTLFWRGAASDGLAAAGNWWPGFVRARLVHLAQTLRSGGGGLLFSSSASSPSKAAAAALPAVDIAFAGNLSHCDASECRSETAAFLHGHNHAVQTDFQEHWLYRHLIDVDGAGFSGRFVPFLRSRSTPYRATLFRTWYDERVHPWKHYVPLDVSLSGLWDVVWLVSKKLIVKQGDSKVPLAEQIAMDGHEWAARALRKEDMQVYMFRLLLEWGRLVDDDREELGYDP